MSLSHPSFRTATSGGQNTASKPIRFERRPLRFPQDRHTLSTFSKYLRGNNGNGNTVFPAVARPPLLLSRRNAATRVACTGSSAGTTARVTADQARTQTGSQARCQARRKRRRTSTTASRTSPASAAASTARRSTQPRQQTQSRCATKSGNASDQPA